MSTYTISEDGTSITHHKCGKTSHHPLDVRFRYCGFCHDYMKDEPDRERSRKKWPDEQFDV